MMSSVAGAPQHEQWRQHLDGCARCRSQVQADHALRGALAAKPELAFSRDFDATLRSRLAPRPQQQRRPLKQAARIGLTFYGAGAAILSGWIVSTISWPESATTTTVAVSLTVALVSLPLSLLLAGARLPWSARRV
jgi:hypothetical protein